MRMMSSNGIPEPVSVVRALVWSLILVFYSQDRGVAQTVLNVADFGAQGDARPIVVNTFSNSAVATTAPGFEVSGADVGKLIEIFGAGPLGTSTNHQDLLATITNVSVEQTFS
jgi:hypothetical protein